MSNPLIGNIEAFDVNDDDFPCYPERREQYLLANNIIDDKKKDGHFLDIGWWKDIEFTERLGFSSQTRQNEILRNP